MLVELSLSSRRAEPTVCPLSEAKGGSRFRLLVDRDCLNAVNRPRNC